MDKETLSNYGWITICVIALAVMLAFATPFGEFVKNATMSTVRSFKGANDAALNSTTNAEDATEALAIAELGTTYRRTGFHFDKRLEKMGTDIKFLKKNTSLSFSSPNSNSTVIKKRQTDRQTRCIS